MKRGRSVTQLISALESDEPVVITRQGPIASLILNRPADGNAIDSTLRHGLIDAIDQLSKMRDIAVVILTGAGDGFSIGGDVAEFSNLTVHEAEKVAKLQVQTLQALSRIKQPLISAIKGPCLGVGFELALCADIRFSQSDGRFGLPGINLGITPAGSTTVRLASIIAGGGAQALMLTGSVIDAERAFTMGLLTAVLAPDEFDAGVEQLVGHMASLSPIAVEELKSLVALPNDKHILAADKAGIKAFTRCYAEGDANQRWHSVMGQAPKAPRSLH